MTLGQSVHAFRMERHLKLTDIARRSGLSQSYLSRIENDLMVPSRNVIQLLAFALNGPLQEWMHLANEARLRHFKSKLARADSIGAFFAAIGRTPVADTGRNSSYIRDAQEDQL